MKKISKLLSILIALVMVMSLFVVSAFAVDNDPMVELTTDVYNYLKDKKFDKADGEGSLQGSELFIKTEYGYDLDEDAYVQLTSDAQTGLVQGIYDASYQSKDTNPCVSDETVIDWFEKLQDKEGIGIELLRIVSNTKPDLGDYNQAPETPSKSVDCVSIFGTDVPVSSIVFGIICILLLGILIIVASKKK